MNEDSDPAGFDYENVIWGAGSVIAPDKADFLNHSLHLTYALQALSAVHGRVVEIGCGSGRFIASVGAARPDLKMHGCDVSQAALKIAAQRPGLQVAVADAGKLPYPDGHFSAVLMIDVLEHLPDPSAALREVHRVLAPGGVFHLVFPCEGHPLTLHGRIDAIARLKRKHAGHIQRLDPKALHLLLRNQGLSLTRERSSYHLFGQLYDTLVFWMVERALARGVDMHKTRNEKIENETGGLVSRLRSVISVFLYAEARVFARVPFGMTVHVDCLKS